MTFAVMQKGGTMDDYISRKAAIDALEELKTRYFDRKVIIGKTQDVINNLPSAQPERKKGKWLFTDAAPHRVYCSVCYKTYVPNKEWIAWAEDMVPKNFCPNCGADMRGES